MPDPSNCLRELQYKSLLTYDTHCHAVPRLESFNAVAQGGGRSVLLEWELEYDGGREVNTIVVEVDAE